MNDDVVIRFENVSKKYKIRSGGLRHAVQNAASRLNPFRRFGDNGKPRKAEEQVLNSQALNESIVEDGKVLWALQDVSFEVKRGEVLGIIGPNGAGKSTILKLISGITFPTSGNIQVKGKVGALIEVGAGFHPELTGRENIYLNGSILGLKKKDIDERFDSIVEFSELRKFLDTPVKKYSSGMYVRLGFSVAAQMDPEILLIDEVLSVGDEAFRIKCLDRIMELKKSEIGIIFVSHSLHSVMELSDRCILLNNGIIEHEGTSVETVNVYKKKVMLGYSKNSSMPGQSLQDANASSAVRISRVELMRNAEKASGFFYTGDKMQIVIHYKAFQRVWNPNFAVEIHRVDGIYCYGVNTKWDKYQIPYIEGDGRVTFEMDSMPLLTGVFFLRVGILDEQAVILYDYQSRLNSFEVLSNTPDMGVVCLQHRWIHDD